MTGDAIHADWFPQWQIDYLLRHNAIVVLPNYRLLPEAKGIEILDDVHDFWAWLARDFPVYLASETKESVKVDLTKVLVTGESAGGYLSIQSALGSGRVSAEDVGSVMLKAAIATYPVLDIKSRFFSEEYEKSILGAPTLPKEILATFMQGVEQDAKAGNRRVVSAAVPPDRLPITLSIVQQGLYPKYLGDEKILYPLERIDEVNAADVPSILIMHGRDDTAVPVEGSQKWTDKAKQKFGDDKVDLVLQPGEHGFDNDPSVTLEMPWLKTALARITQAWLGSN